MHTLQKRPANPTNAKLRKRTQNQMLARWKQLLSRKKMFWTLLTRLKHKRLSIVFNRPGSSTRWEVEPQMLLQVNKIFPFSQRRDSIMTPSQLIIIHRNTTCITTETTGAGTVSTLAQTNLYSILERRAVKQSKRLLCNSIAVHASNVILTL